MAVLIVVVLVLLIALLRRGDGDQSATPSAAAPPPVPAGPVPTLPFVAGGYHYTIGIGPFTPVVEVPHGDGSSSSAPPGRHYLTATLVVRNDQTDRSAPALVDSDGDALQIFVGLAPVPFLPPVDTIGVGAPVSGCINDPRNPKLLVNPDPLYRGITPQTCIVQATDSPVDPAPLGTDDDHMPPGGETFARVLTTNDLPDNVPVAQTTAWVVTAQGVTDGEGPEGNYAILDPIR